jgi:hypothetical protein
MSLYGLILRDYSTCYSGEYISKEETQESIVVITTLPGCYIGDNTFSELIEIMGWEAALGLCKEADRNAQILMLEEYERRRPQEQLSFDHVPKLIGVDHPRDPTPGIAAMPFPYLNLKTGRAESGIWCRGCEHDFLNVLSHP